MKGSISTIRPERVLPDFPVAPASSPSVGALGAGVEEHAGPDAGQQQQADEAEQQHFLLAAAGGVLRYGVFFRHGIFPPCQNGI
jgi:hypothetical protein